MSKHSKIVTISIDTRAKQKLANAGNSVAELASAIMIDTDDRFAPKRGRK